MLCPPHKKKRLLRQPLFIKCNYFNVIASAEFELNKHINFAYRANVQYTGQENDNHGDGWQPVILDATAVTSYYNKYKQNNLYLDAYIKTKEEKLIKRIKKIIF